MAAPVVGAAAGAAGKAAGAAGGGAKAGAAAKTGGKLPPLPQGGQKPEQDPDGAPPPSAPSSGADLALKAGLAVLLALLALLLLPVLFVVVILGQGTHNPVIPCRPGEPCLANALPMGATPFLPAYFSAAKAYKVNQYVLLAIHEKETNFSGSELAGVKTGVNFAGCCAGPMQFSITGGATPEVGGTGGTWEAYKDAYAPTEVNPLRLRPVTGEHIGRPAHYPGRIEEPHPNVYDSYDAIFAAAKYLHDIGASPRLDAQMQAALAQYGGNPLTAGAQNYAADVMTKARAYEAAVADDAAGRAQGAPRTLERVIWAANYIDRLDLPYCWGGGHAPKPGPSTIIANCWSRDERGGRTHTARGLDCSGSVRWLLVLAGFPDPGPLHSSQFGTPHYELGAGKSVTILFNNEHVYAVIDNRPWTTSSANPAHGPGFVTGYRGFGFKSSHPPGL